VSDGYPYAAVVDASGDLVWEARLRTREPERRRWLVQLPASVVALETGTHSRWRSRAAAECGHRVVVANARQQRFIYGGHAKTDRLDAVRLARLARVDERWLHPVERRPENEQADLALITARDARVGMRTQAINLVRGLVQAAGGRVPEGPPTVRMEAGARGGPALSGTAGRRDGALRAHEALPHPPPGGQAPGQAPLRPRSGPVGHVACDKTQENFHRP
jgi:transposase